jgi:hypothetical protein
MFLKLDLQGDTKDIEVYNQFAVTTGLQTYTPNKERVDYHNKNSYLNSESSKSAFLYIKNAFVDKSLTKQPNKFVKESPQFKASMYLPIPASQEYTVVKEDSAG